LTKLLRTPPGDGRIMGVKAPVFVAAHHKNIIRITTPTEMHLSTDTPRDVLPGTRIIVYNNPSRNANNGKNPTTKNTKKFAK
jgi:hypothetical protein